MRRLSILFFAALMVANSASAEEKRRSDLIAFDQAMQRFAGIACGTALPEGRRPGNITITIWAYPDDKGNLKTRHIVLKDCQSFKIRPGEGDIQWPNHPPFQVPKSDGRPDWKVAFDHGVKHMLGKGCDDTIRPVGYGRFKAVEFSIHANIASDGIMRTTWISAIGCDWHPLAPSG